MHRQKILLTGANGYLGQVLKTIPVTWDWITCDIAEGDLDYIGCFSKIPDEILQSVDSVLHMADQRLQDLDANNLDKNINKHKIFIEHLQTFSNIKKITFCSSCSVYGQSTQYLNEESEVLLNSYYAKSKYQTEQLIAKGKNFCIIRFGTAYGSSPALRTDLLVNNLILSAVEKKEITLYDPSSYRPFINSHDFCRTLIFSIENNLVGIYNSAENNLSKKDLIQELVHHVPNIERYIKYTNDIVDPRNYKVSSDKLMRMGFEFSIDFKSGVEQLFNQINKSYFETPKP